MATHECGKSLAFALLLTVCDAAAANVVDVASNGFTVQVTAHFAAPADMVFAALIKPARWWGPDHTFSHDAANLTLDAKAGGCWCEKLPRGGSAVHLTVVYVDPGKVLRLRGALGTVFRLAIATLRATNDPTFALRGALAQPVIVHRPAITDENELGAPPTELRDSANPRKGDR